MIWGKLEKLKIKSFPTVERLEGSPGVETCDVMFNPESYSFKYENEFQRPKSINGYGQVARYSFTRSQSLSFKFLIDDTNATSGVLTGLSENYGSSSIIGRVSSISVGNFAPRKTIRDRVEEFLDLTGRVDGAIHEPRYLRLEWGDLRFDCRLKSVEVSYTMFTRSGKPIRAELNAEFVADIEPQKQASLVNLQSADLTHTRQVSDQDTLPLIAHHIYQDSTQYIRVAQINKINNFRRLKAGIMLRFPPITNKLIP